MIKHNIYLCSFASPDLKESRKRFLKSAKSLKLYKKIKIYGHNDLTNFLKKRINKRLSVNELRGYGYWCWKPYIIKKFSETLPKNSIIQYLDIGFEINRRGLKNLEKYIDIVKKKNFLTFKYFKPKNFNENYKYQVYREYEYTKKDIFSDFNLKLTSPIIKDYQIVSGILFFKNNMKSKKILEIWKKKLLNEVLVDDTTSLKKNHKKFIQNRHDQSFFSIICKLNNVFSLSASDEFEYVHYKNKIYWDHLKNKPFLAKRLKNRSFINNIKRIPFFLKKKFNNF